MIRSCTHADFEQVFTIDNDGARAYKGIIPDDRWSDPYMSREKLQHEIDEGVMFWGDDEKGALTGVMGIQPVQDVTLIRHAYVRTTNQKQGIGSRLLSHLQQFATTPVLIGTWAHASWAIHFYERHGFRIVPPPEKERLLKKYWSIPARQIATSVVLAASNWPARTANHAP